MESKRKIEKSNGNGEIILVDNPDYINDEGNFKKHRKPLPKPKKKKRK